MGGVYSGLVHGAHKLDGEHHRTESNYPVCVERQRRHKQPDVKTCVHCSTVLKITLAWLTCVALPFKPSRIWRKGVGVRWRRVEGAAACAPKPTYHGFVTTCVSN